MGNMDANYDPMSLEEPEPAVNIPSPYLPDDDDEDDDDEDDLEVLPYNGLTQNDPVLTTVSEKTDAGKWKRVNIQVGFDVTRKGERSLVINGYKFTKSRDGMGGRIFWRCSRRECKATAVTVSDRVEHVRSVHSHDPPVAAEFFTDRTTHYQHEVKFTDLAASQRSGVYRRSQLSDSPYDGEPETLKVSVGLQVDIDSSPRRNSLSGVANNSISDHFEQVSPGEGEAPSSIFGVDRMLTTNSLTVEALTAVLNQIAYGGDEVSSGRESVPLPSNSFGESHMQIPGCSSTPTDLTTSQNALTMPAHQERITINGYAKYLPPAPCSDYLWLPSSAYQNEIVAQNISGLDQLAAIASSISANDHNTREDSSRQSLFQTTPSVSSQNQLTSTEAGARLSTTLSRLLAQGYNHSSQDSTPTTRHSESASLQARSTALLQAFDGFTKDVVSCRACGGLGVCSTGASAGGYPSVQTRDRFDGLRETDSNHYRGQPPRMTPLAFPYSVHQGVPPPLVPESQASLGTPVDTASIEFQEATARIRRCFGLDNGALNRSNAVQAMNSSILGTSVHWSYPGGETTSGLDLTSSTSLPSQQPIQTIHRTVPMNGYTEPPLPPISASLLPRVNLHQTRPYGSYRSLYNSLFPERDVASSGHHPQPRMSLEPSMYAGRIGQARTIPCHNVLQAHPVQSPSRVNSNLFIHWKKERMKETVDDGLEHDESDGEIDVVTIDDVDRSSIGVGDEVRNVLGNKRRWHESSSPNAPVRKSPKCSVTTPGGHFGPGAHNSQLSSMTIAADQSASLQLPPIPGTNVCFDSTQRVTRPTDFVVLCNRIESITLIKVLNTLQQLTAKLDADAGPTEVIQYCRAIQACVETLTAIKQTRHVSSLRNYIDSIEVVKQEEFQQFHSTTSANVARASDMLNQFVRENPTQHFFN